MSTFQPINPKPFMKSLIGKQVVVRLKWNKTEYRGQLISTDNYLNLQLNDTFEIIYDSDDNPREEAIGSIFIRCNNVLFIREYKDQDPSKSKISDKTDSTTVTETVETETETTNGDAGSSGIEVTKVELKETEEMEE
ncbi:hypothetical protein KGF57_001620 [Candida theae]|uniref:Sm protein F n=1 Tax=Candida theae TaxID=1198502 RepID=A0AAD5FZI6_9ASCO|nr:uncharacterized protein KGF57_001620 [Candida theae]KAI5961686.1 hypothetical protein KGF57_001620 [Candida theae]